MVNEDLPSGESWHADLINRASKKTQKRPVILSKVTSNFADETRRFRNVAVRSYDSFLPQYADVSVSAAESLSISLLPELKAFQALIDG
jgi:hypothetical protein